MNSAAPSLATLLHETSRALRRRFEVRMAGHGLSSAQWRLLVLACKYPGASQSHFADRLEIEPISVSRLIDRMVKGGWLMRQDDPKDRRVKLVLPTDKALSAFGEIMAVADDVYREALVGLTATESQILMKGLSTISKNLAALDGATLACALPDGATAATPDSTSDDTSDAAVSA